MEKYQAEFALVDNALRENPEGLSIQDIAELLKINRITVSKYLDILQIQGQVDAKRVGTSKVYVRAHRLPAASIDRICPFPYVMVDKNHTITKIHPDFLKFFPGKDTDYEGKRIDLLTLPCFQNQGVQAAVKDAIRGKESVLEVVTTPEKKEYAFRLSFLPVVFRNGKPGMVLLFENQTDTRETARLLQQMEGRYQALIQDQVGYILRFLPDGTITSVNDTYCREVGREKEALVGSAYHPFLFEEDKEKVKRHFASLSIENPVDIIEHRAVMANGQVRWQRWRDRALFDNQGNIIEYQSVGIDITDFKHAQEKLRTSYEHLEDLISLRTQELQQTNKQLYREIAQREAMERKLKLTQFAMDHSADMAIWFDVSGTIIYANHSAAAALGYPHEALGTLRWQDLFRTGTMPEWGTIYEQCKGTTHFVKEGVITRNDGSGIPVDLHFNHLAYNNQEYCCGFIRDISERTRFIEALQESKEQIQNFLQNLPIGLYRKDPEGAVIFANPYMRKLLEYPEPRDLSSFNLDRMVANPRKRAEMRGRLLREGLIANEQVEMKRSSGDPFWARVSEIGVSGEEGGLKYIDGILEDITEIKNAEEGLKNARMTLKFLNSVTLKEIRNELFILSGYLDLLSDSPDEQTKRFVSRLVRSAANIGVNLDFGSRYQNVGGASPVWLSLREAFLFAISHHDLEGIDVRVDLGSYAIWADPHIELVFSLLLENSLVSGGGVHTLSIGAEVHDKVLRVTYSDDSSGIPEESKQAIFEPDYNPGTASGMHLAREILSITGISIRECGEPGKGVRFVLEIPRFRADADPLHEKNPAAPSLAGD